MTAVDIHAFAAKLRRASFPHILNCDMATHDPLTDVGRAPGFGLAACDAPVVPPGRMTEDEFVAWCDEDVKAEWIDGEVLIMSPSSAEHVRIQNFLSHVLSYWVEHFNLGEVLGPEFQIRLAKQRRRRVPDLLFVAKERANLVMKHHLEGPPDVAVEVVSPDSVRRDWRDKYHEYESASVREYWIVDPVSERMEAYALGEDGKFSLLPEQDGKLASTVLTGFYLRPKWFWPGPLPKVRAVLSELSVP